MADIGDVIGTDPSGRTIYLGRMGMLQAGDWWRWADDPKGEWTIAACDATRPDMTRCEIARRPFSVLRDVTGF